MVLQLFLTFAYCVRLYMYRDLLKLRGRNRGERVALDINHDLFLEQRVALKRAVNCS